MADQEMGTEELRQWANGGHRIEYGPATLSDVAGGILRLLDERQPAPVDLSADHGAGLSPECWDLATTLDWLRQVTRDQGELYSATFLTGVARAALRWLEPKRPRIKLLWRYVLKLRGESDHWEAPDPDGGPWYSISMTQAGMFRVAGAGPEQEFPTLAQAQQACAEHATRTHGGTP